MSGICGVVGLDRRGWDTADLDGVLARLAPLGTDGGGTWSGVIGAAPVALGAALRHSTPQDRADRQPAVSADGSLVLVGDLRIDNRDELRGLLGLGDAEPDSAFVLAAYARWGEASLERLHGEFAFALADGRRGGVLLARDHVGLRPLVVHQRAGVVAFASTALALTAFEGVARTLDARRALEMLALVLDGERTLVEDVRWLPPATALWIEPGDVRRWPWWAADPDDIRDGDPPAAHDEALRAAFDLAVKARLRGLGQVGATTSGGLDSASVTATAAGMLAPGRLRTYTSAPPAGWVGPTRAGWDADEAALVRELAAHHRNLDPEFVHVTPGTPLFAGHEALWELGGAPALNPCNLLWLHAIHARCAADGVTTLLTGSLGNHGFSAPGVPPAGAARRLARRLRHRPRPVGAAVRSWLAVTALRPERYAELDLAALRPELDLRHRPSPRRLAITRLGGGAGQAEAAAALAARTGVEERDPTIDRRVLEVAMRQPDAARVRDGLNRAVVRHAMVDRLPPAIAFRTRRGEQLPDWLDVLTAARTEIEAELEALDGHALSRELIDVERLRGLVARWPDRNRAADPAVIGDYRQALLRALYVSRYLRWFDGRG